MQRNLKVLQSLKYEVEGVKLYPYAKLKLLMRSPSLPAQLQSQLKDQRSMSPMAILSSFLHDKQLHKMLKTQVPMSPGATLFKDIVSKMNLEQFIRKHLLQTAYLEIAFIQARGQQTKSQKLIQQDLEKKTIQSACTMFLRSLPTDLFSRHLYNKLLDSKSTTQLEEKMDAIAEKMQLKSQVETDTIKEKFAAFVDEIKEPDFHWPIKYIIAQRITASLDIIWNSEDYLQYALDYIADVLFHIVFHPTMVIHLCPWIATDRDLVRSINSNLTCCPWHTSLPDKEVLDEIACLAIADKMLAHEKIKVPVTNFIEVTKGSMVFNYDTLIQLFNEEVFKHQNIEVPSDYKEEQLAKEVEDGNDAILLAQQEVNQADAETFNSGSMSNTIQKAQEELKVVPPVSTLTRFTPKSRITIKSAVMAANRNDIFKDLDLTSVFTFHLQPAEDRDASSFLSKLTLADDVNTQRILVNTKSTIIGHQPNMVPMPCLFEITTTDIIKRRNKEVKKTVKKRCTKFACNGVPFCPMHLDRMSKLSTHEKYTPGRS